MKFIGSWKDKYFGFQHNDWNYYIHILPKDIRFFGFKNELYDGLPIYHIGLWYINLTRIYEY